MSYRINKYEPLTKAIARIAMEEIRCAADELSQDRDHSTHIHEARRCLKRIRALLLLFRRQLPKKFFRAEDRRFRDAGRAFSPPRDVHVQLRTLQKVKISEGNLVCKKLRVALVQRENELIKKHSAQRENIVALLLHAQTQVRHWPLPPMDSADVCCGLKEIFKGARKAFRHAAKNPSAENLHRLRQQTKSLWHGLRLIEPFAAKQILKLIKRTDSLGDILGDGRDFVLLDEALQEEDFQHPKRDFKALSKCICKKRLKFKRRALALGQKLFETKPAAFEKRIGRCLENPKT